MLVWEVSASATIMKKRFPLLPVAELTSTFAILVKFCFVTFAGGTRMIMGVLLVFNNFSVMFARKTGRFPPLLWRETLLRNLKRKEAQYENIPMYKAAALQLFDG